MTGEITLKALLYYILKAKQGGKYLARKRVVDKKTGKMRWGDYKYKPASQRGAHEFTKKVFEKKTKLTDSTHKNSVEKILQNGGHVNLRILRDYPDLANKYNQESRLVAADKIRARVKASKVKLEPQMSEQETKDLHETQNVHLRFFNKEIEKLKKGIEQAENSLKTKSNPKDILFFKTEIEKRYKKLNGMMETVNYISDIKNVEVDPTAIDPDSSTEIYNYYNFGMDWSVDDYKNYKQKVVQNTQTQKEQEQIEQKNKQKAEMLINALLKTGSKKIGRATFKYERKHNEDYYSVEFPYNISDVEDIKRIKESWFSQGQDGKKWYIPKEGISRAIQIFESEPDAMSPSQEKEYYDNKYNRQRYYDRGGKY